MVFGQGNVTGTTCKSPWEGVSNEAYLAIQKPLEQFNQSVSKLERTAERIAGIIARIKENGPLLEIEKGYRSLFDGAESYKEKYQKNMITNLQTRFPLDQKSIPNEWYSQITKTLDSIARYKEGENAGEIVDQLLQVRKTILDTCNNRKTGQAPLELTEQEIQSQKKEVLAIIQQSSEPIQKFSALLKTALFKGFIQNRKEVNSEIDNYLLVIQKRNLPLEYTNTLGKIDSLMGWIKDIVHIVLTDQMKEGFYQRRLEIPQSIHDKLDNQRADLVQEALKLTIDQGQILVKYLQDPRGDDVFLVAKQALDVLKIAEEHHCRDKLEGLLFKKLEMS